MTDESKVVRAVLQIQSATSQFDGPLTGWWAVSEQQMEQVYHILQKVDDRHYLVEMYEFDKEQSKLIDIVPIDEMVSYWLFHRERPTEEDYDAVHISADS